MLICIYKIHILITICKLISIDINIYNLSKNPHVHTNAHACRCTNAILNLYSKI